MKLLRLSALLFFLVPVSNLFAQTSSPTVASIHSQSITTINNTTVNLSSFAGKKVVFIIAPLSVRDSAKIRSIKEFQNKYDTSVQVIGIVTFEEGYKDSLKQAIINRYSNVKPIILTEAIYGTASPQHLQNALFTWLLKKTENKVFDNRFAGDMQKFFIDEQGALYHVASPSLEFASPFIELLVNRKPL